MKPEANQIGFADIIDWISIMFRVESGVAQQFVSRRWIEQLNAGGSASSFLQNYVAIGCMAPIIAEHRVGFGLTGPFADCVQHNPNAAFTMFVPGGATGQDIREKTLALESTRHAFH